MSSIPSLSNKIGVPRGRRISCLIMEMATCDELFMVMEH